MNIERKSIPKDWDLISVEDCFDILDNQRKPLNESERNLMRGDIPYYGANGVVDYVNEFLFDDDLILIAEDGGYFDEFQTRPIAYKVKGKAWINNHAHVLKAKNGFYQDYLFYCLEHKNILIWLNGGTRAKLNKGDLEKLPIQIAPHPEQKAIAQVLSTADTAIQTTEKLIAQKEIRKKWLMQQLLTGKKRLKGFGGEWKEMHLGEMFTERNDTKYFDLPLLSIGQNGVYPQDESIKKDTSNEDKSKYKRICPGDIGYNTMRMWQGRSALSDLEGIVSPAYTVVSPKKNTDSLFFSYLFKMPKMTNLFWRNSQGLVDDTLNCKFKDFSIVKVFLPTTKEEQTAIAHVLQAADKEISLLKTKAEKLREQKKGLMQQLLTGKVRLKIKE
jgi:type I restriction enzyme S subunit